MTQVALQDSLGVVTHSRWMAEQVAGQTVGAVTVARLPHHPPPPVPVQAIPDAVAPVTLVVAGAVNENKCVERVIRAMGGSALLRERTRLRVVGPIMGDRRAALAALARSEGVAGQVEVLGALPRAPFDAVVRSADVYVCLRDPVFEAMSASLLEGLATARPVVVYDQGHYVELPDDAVVKVDPAGGSDRLREALEALVTDPEWAALVGQRGRQHLETMHAVEQYADALAAAGTLAVAARPIVLAVRRARYHLQHAGIAGSEAARERLAVVVARLLVGPSQPAEEPVR
jgi:glycosyltransferase involved in cell wall biosynthesis